MATAGVMTWSKTAASNATADPTVNWAEGQAPSSVNDSARAEMASVAKWRDDISGTLTTGGSATAYTLTTNATFATAAAMSGAMITFIPHATSGAAPTLAVDGLTARAINISTGVPVPTGALILGTPYTVTYIHASTEFILSNALDVSVYLPSGMLAPYAGSSAPTGWLLCFGQSLLRTDYAALFTAIGTAYGAADGTHFSLPDLRGRAPFGRDDMGGSQATRLTTNTMSANGVTLGATGGAENVVISATNVPQLAVAITDPTHRHGISEQIGTRAVGDAGGGVTIQALRSDGTGAADQTDAASTGITATANTASANTALNKMPPAIILNYIIKT